MKTDWIEQAMKIGATMRVRCDGNRGYDAEMTWPSGAFVFGPYTRTIETAIQELNDLLRDDCAKEMRDKGAV